MRIKISKDEEIEIPVLKLVWIPVIAVIVLLGATTVYQIDAEQEGVLLRFGRHVETKGPGLHFKLPYPVEAVEKVPTRLVDVLEFGYRSGRAGTRGQGFEDESSMLTGDLNIVQAGFDVQFSREDPTAFLFNVKDPVETLRDISQSVMREIMGDRASIPILTIGRAEIQMRARVLIQEYTERFRMGIRINEVNLIFVSPPQQVQGAFNDLNKAEQDAVRFLEEASRQYQEKVPQARGSAERMVLDAEGFRERRVRVARGEADRFDSMLEAYLASPEVTRQRLYLESLERQMPKLKEIIVVDEKMSGLLPLLNLKEGGSK